MANSNTTFAPPQPPAINPFANRGGLVGVRNPFAPYNPSLNPGLYDNPGRGNSSSIGGGLGDTSDGRGTASGIQPPGIPAQGPAYNGNYDPATGWGVPGRGLPVRPGTGRFGGGANDMSAYNPALDPSAHLGWGGGGAGAKGPKSVGGYGGGGSWWDNGAMQGMSDQTRALAPLYAANSNMPGYLQKIIGRRVNDTPTMGQGMPGINV